MIFLASSDAFMRAEKAGMHYPNLDIRKLSVGVDLEEENLSKLFTYVAVDEYNNLGVYKS